MQSEEKIYQFGDFVFNQKYELKQTISRSNKAFNSDGVFDGVSDDFGFDRRFLSPTKISIEHSIADNDDLKLNWDILSNCLLNSGKQPVFFSCVQDTYTVGNPIIKYNYGVITKVDNDYLTRFKKLKFEIELDSPYLFDCTDQVQFLGNADILPPTYAWNSTAIWNSTATWSNPPNYQPLTSMSNSNIVKNFGIMQENGLGKLFLEDQFFFKKWQAPTFNSSDFQLTINTSNWQSIGSQFQTRFDIANLKLNGSLDNFCYIMQLSFDLAPFQFVEIINENNLTGIRLENISSSTITGLKDRKSVV